MKNSFDMSSKNREIRVYGNARVKIESGPFSTPARTLKKTLGSHPSSEPQKKLLGKVNQDLKNMKLPF